MLARRSALALAVLAAVATLAASPALAQGGSTSPSPMRATALLGFEDGDGPAGLALRVDGELVQRPLSPTVGFSIVGSLGYSHFSDDGGVSDPFFGLESHWEQSLGVFKMIPAARFTFGRNPRVRPYADAGLGLYYASWNYESTETTLDPFTGFPITLQTEADDSEVGIVLRFAGGVAFEVSPGFSLGAEFGLMPYVGDVADDTTVNLMLAAQFRL